MHIHVTQYLDSFLTLIFLVSEYRRSVETKKQAKVSKRSSSGPVEDPEEEEEEGEEEEEETPSQDMDAQEPIECIELDSDEEKNVVDIQ